MKVLFKITIFTSPIFLVVLGVLFFSQSAQGKTEEEQNVSGWAWVGNADNGVPHIGWVSLNCYNYYSSEGVKSKCADAGGVDYGVTIDPESGDMSGYMWNAVTDASGAQSGLGWLDLDPDAFPAEPQWPAKAEMSGDNKGQISGWARIKSIKDEGEKVGYDNWGWVHLGPTAGPSRPYGVYIDFSNSCTDCPIKGYAWAGGEEVDDIKEGDGLGWIFFGDDTQQLLFYNIVSGEVTGWAWLGNNTDVPTDYTNIGWISLNCSNPEINECTNSKYKVMIDPVGGDFKYNKDEGIGYAWIGSGFDTPNQPDSIGWIDFNPNPFPADHPDYSAKVFLTQEQADNDPFGPFDGKKYLAGDIVGWARINMLIDDDEVDEANLHPDDWGWVKLHRTASTPDAAKYGLALSFGSEELEELGEGGKIGGRCYKTGGCGDDDYLEFTDEGYAWSGGGSTYTGYSDDVGFGWIMFDARSRGLGPTYVSPFFTVEGGSIYAKAKEGKEGIGSPTTFTPPAKNLGNEGEGYWYNATYMIVSGGTITHFCSAEGENQAKNCAPGSDFIKENIEDPFSAPLNKNEYTNALGKIDVDGLVSDTGENKYGHTVVNYKGDATPANILNDSGNSWAQEGATLNGKVYHIQGDFTIDTDPVLTFNAGDPNGAGLIIVDGNLKINANTDYEPKDIDNIVKLPVVGWIVRGDIIINGEVAKTVGVYISVGQDEDHGGTIKTGESDKLLEVSGAMIAKSFEFQRTGFGTFAEIQPAEKIVNDGRAGANTPPGLQDFSLAFPIIRQAAPVEIEE